MGQRRNPTFAIWVQDDGALLVKGEVTLRRMAIEPEGRHFRYVDKGEIPTRPTFALCRCGASSRAPLCDGSHEEAGFDGAETAPRTPFRERAKRFSGPGVDLLDDYDRCALARFCHTDEGNIWSLVERSGDADARDAAVKAANECPAARLVALDKTSGEALEWSWPNEIVVLEDPSQNCDGPLWIRGNFTLISAEGEAYEKSGKYTLCRCGLSGNKPLCDAEHAFSHWHEATPPSPRE